MTLKRVMVVDDSEADQFITKFIIESFDPDLEIIQACDGKEALALIEGCPERPDVIFLDINMPVMDGFAFLDAFCKPGETANRVIMLSSSDQPQDRARAHQHSCVMDYIVKPLGLGNMEQLLAKLA